MKIPFFSRKSKAEENMEIDEEKRYFDDKDKYHKNEIFDRGMEMDAYIQEYEAETGDMIISMIYPLYKDETICRIAFKEDDGLGFYEKFVLEIE